MASGCWQNGMMTAHGVGRHTWKRTLLLGMLPAARAARKCSVARPRLAGVAQLAEVQVFWIDAVGELQRHLSLADGHQHRVGAQHGGSAN